MSSECDLKAQEQHSNQYSGQPTYIPFQVSEASPSYIFLFCTQISFSCCLNLNPTCWDKVYCLLQVLTIASQLLHQLCPLWPCLASESIVDNSPMASPSALLPVTMSGIREHCGQQPYGFSLSSAPCDQVWHQRALWTTVSWLLPQLCFLRPCLASESIRDNSSMASPSSLLPMTMSGIREHCGQQPYGFSLSSAPCGHVWHQRALWTGQCWRRSYINYRVFLCLCLCGKAPPTSLSSARRTSLDSLSVEANARLMATSCCRSNMTCSSASIWISTISFLPDSLSFRSSEICQTWGQESSCKLQQKMLLFL